MAPAPMKTMLQKQPRNEATETWIKRKAMVIQEMPGTSPGTVNYILRSNSLRSTERKLFSSYILQFTMICKVDEDMVGCSHNPNCFYLESVIQYKHTKHY